MSELKGDLYNLDIDKRAKDLVMLRPKDQLDHFDPVAYLRQYYGDNDMSRGLKIILFFLPNIAARMNKCQTLLDVGSGPAVYMALGFRDQVDQIYLSDFTEQNRRELRCWKNGSANFNWAPIAKAIAKLEGKSDWEKLENDARRKLTDIIYCDVHSEMVLDETYSGQTFDIVSTVFCLEYASSDYSEYKSAMAKVCKLIKPNGTLIMGGAFEETHYTIGPKKFACHYLTEDQLFDSLRDAGIDVDSNSFAFYFHEGAFVVVGKKMN